MSVYNSIPIANCSINKYVGFKKYKDTNKEPLTQEVVLELPPFNLQPHNKNPDRYYYGVRIVTGSQLGSSHDNTVSVELIGDAGKTGKIGIGSYFNWLYSSEDTYDDYIIECESDLGEVQLVTISNDSARFYQSSANWFVDFTYVINLKSKLEQNFPCYHWLGDGDEQTNSANTGILRSAEGNRVIEEQRLKQVQERKNQYIWEYFPDVGQPSAMTMHEKHPLDEVFERVKEINFIDNLATSGILANGESIWMKINHIIGKVFGSYEALGVDSMHSLHNFYKVAKGLVDKSSSGAEMNNQEMLVAYETYRFASDVHFGEQILNGVNCVVVKKCNALPGNFPVTNEMVQPFLNNQQTLEQAIQDDRIYICDLSQIMHGLPCKPDQYCAAPLCLLYVNGSNQLVPIAIQLKRDVAVDNPIFLPSDDRIDWLLAKMYYSSASAQHHQLSTHYISCHAVMEAYGVATMRNLPDAHPVYKLLRPHFRYTMAINSAARKTLINNDGIIDQLFSIGGKDDSSGKSEFIRRTNAIYDVHWTNIRKDLDARGISPDNDKKLPNYFYRDDGVRLWDAIRTFVASIIDIFYTDDKSVVNDSELKSWVEDIHQNAFPEFKGNKSGRGFPNKITTKKMLSEYCTLIMFTGSVQHSAVNFGQFQSYGYVPNAPMSMRMPLPSKKGERTHADLLNTLPTTMSTGLAVTVAWSLSQFSPDEIYLGGYQTMWYTEQKAKDCVTKFLDQLRTLNERIKERNEKLDIPYRYLISSNCPNSITI